MKKYILVLLGLFLFLPVLAAEKKAKAEQPAKLKTLFKTAKDALKAGNNQQNAQNALLGALPRKDITEKDRARIFFVSAQLDQSMNAVENRKAYLKQAYDTAVFFSTTLNIYKHLICCDSVDRIPNAKGQVKRKYASDVNGLMKKHRRNLLNGGKFQMRKRNYPQAFEYMDAFIRTASDPADTLVQRVCYWASICGYNTKNPQTTRKYIDRAIQWADSTLQPVLQEYKARSFQWQNDQAHWIEELNVGVSHYPAHDYFFLNLLDVYNESHQYDKGLALADTLLDTHQEKALFWYAKSLLSLGKEDYEDCIIFSDSCIVRDPEYADAYYNKGISYCNLALIAAQDACNDLTNPKCVEDRNRIMALYAKARPPMEKFRQLQPDKQERWLSPLYRIYLNLNLGKEFDEIDALMKAKK